MSERCKNCGRDRAEHRQLLFCPTAFEADHKDSRVHAEHVKILRRLGADAGLLKIAEQAGPASTEAAPRDEEREALRELEGAARKFPNRCYIDHAAKPIDDCMWCALAGALARLDAVRAGK